MAASKQGWVAGLLLGLGTVLVGSSWAREPSAGVVAPALGQLELELGAGDDSAPSPTFELAVRGTSAGSEVRQGVLLDGQETPRVRLRLPAGAYAVTLNTAAMPEPADAAELPPRIAEPSTRWLALPAAEVVLVAPGLTTRARLVVAPTAPGAVAWEL